MKRPLLWIGGILWISGIGVGMGLLWEYALTPGMPARPSERWPAESRLPRAPGRPTLVMAAHPRCPCTRASLGELSWIMAHSQGQLSAFVLFLKPSTAQEGWEKTDLWQTVTEMHDVSVWQDIDGREAARFDAHTSGQTVLYDKDGKLLFRGGITMARGHAGANIGRNAIVGLLAEGSESAETPVYGCPLSEQASATAKDRTQ
jgi:hypothetical protein